jgi:hypothetical protein
VFVGHYSVSFAGKRADPGIPLWLLFIAVQWLDVLWAPLILLGVEHARLVPGITATNPLDLYYMPYTHSLVAAIVWSLAAYGLTRLVAPGRPRKTGWILAGAVFSHWLLDFVVHRPDLSLYDDSAKVGLGLWNHPALAFGLEGLLLFGGMALWFQTRPPRKAAAVVFGCAMLALQAYIFFGPPPVSIQATAVTALVAYALFAGVIAWLERPARS